MLRILLITLFFCLGASSGLVTSQYNRTNYDETTESRYRNNYLYSLAGKISSLEAGIITLELFNNLDPTSPQKVTFVVDNETNYKLLTRQMELNTIVRENVETTDIFQLSPGDNIRLVIWRDSENVPMVAHTVTKILDDNI